MRHAALGAPRAAPVNHPSHEALQFVRDDGRAEILHSLRLLRPHAQVAHRATLLHHLLEVGKLARARFTHQRDLHGADAVARLGERATELLHAEVLRPTLEALGNLG